MSSMFFSLPCCPIVLVVVLRYKRLTTVKCSFTWPKNPKYEHLDELYYYRNMPTKVINVTKVKYLHVTTYRGSCAHFFRGVTLASSRVDELIRKALRWLIGAVS